MEAENADIYDFETTASLIGVSFAADLCPGRPVFLRCDNRAASQTLARASCKTNKGRMICGSFGAIAATFSDPVRIESANGTLNPSDPPSRNCVSRSKPFHVQDKKRDIHRILLESINSKVPLKNAQFAISAGITGFLRRLAVPETLSRVAVIH